MLSVLASLRGLFGWTMDDDTAGLTTFRRVPWAVTNLLIAFAGYAAPPLLGLAGAALISAGNPWAVLVLSVLLSFLATVASRNGLAFLIPLLVVVGVGWTLVAGSTGLQVGVAVGVVWLMLFGGLIDALALPSGGGDARALAQKTLVPGFVWKLAWIAVALYCLVVGGQLLLRPGYAV